MRLDEIDIRAHMMSMKLDVWRAVEAQHQVSTRKLVDSDAEQHLLEQMIDAVKPADITNGRLHYLIATPFRYPPLRHGSRFGGRFERGIWYGAIEQRTVCAEVAYYRLLFLAGTHAALGTIRTDLTLFSASAACAYAIDLTRAPFNAHERLLTSPTSYDATQALGTGMRSHDVQAFCYTSARDPAAGTAFGAFTPDVFGRRQPRRLETWQCSATIARVEFVRRDYFRRESHAFVREQFMVDGALPSPAV